jgi:NADPH-dependent glutamate synthase beta subunit-like oxidoreductase
LETAKTSVSKEKLLKLIDAEKLKNCFECGICTGSCSMAELLGEDYNPRTLLEKIFQSPDEVLTSDQLWLCGWCYRCYKRCPQGLKLPEIFLFMRATAVEHGHTRPVEKALEKIVENVPLPLVTTLVCFHPERAGLDKAEMLARTEQLYKEDLERRKKRKTAKGSEHNVVVLGSGPAGLTVAHELARKGHKVTLFEALPDLGGMLTKCIPEYRLPRRVLIEEVQVIKNLGVEARTGITLGKNLNFSDLWKDGYEAIFIGVGAHKSQNLRMEGEDLKGVVHALDFLWGINSGEKTEVGQNVIVVGGGNVAIDAARTALLHGANEVTVFYRRSREEMPANPWEVKEAENEGVKIELLVAPKRILEGNGRVSGLECIRMQLGESDESGRRKPVPVEGSEFTRKADMVILAIGEVSDLGFLPKEITLNEDGTVWVNPITMETSLQGVFAGGDVVAGPASVIEAIRDGKRAAVSIENYLKSLGG